MAIKRSVILEALDYESFEYMQVAFPDLLAAIEKEVGNGMKPDQVMRLVLQAVGPDRTALAYRCLQAAHYLAKIQG